MLSKDSRLNLSKDFKWVAAGKRLETKFLKIFIKYGDNKIPKVGIATSSKTFKKATERNKARRLTSAVFEELYPILPSAINILVLPKAGLINVKSTDVLDEVKAELQKEQIIYEKNID